MPETGTLTGATAQNQVGPWEQQQLRERSTLSKQHDQEALLQFIIITRIPHWGFCLSAHVQSAFSEAQVDRIS